MDPALISALSAVLGSIVGASATIATSWITQTTQGKREQLRADLQHREALYGDFINECSKLAMDALAHGIDSPEKIWSAYALLNRIRLSASEPVLAQAEALLKRIAAQYFSPNVSIDEFRAIALSREADPLKLFGEACRSELKVLRAEPNGLQGVKF